MISSLFLWLVCFMVFIPIGIDISVFIGYESIQGGWITHLCLLFVTLILAVFNGLEARIKEKIP